MDSVLSRLASRSVGHASALSLENDIVDASGYCDAQLVSLDELSLSSASEADQIVEVVDGQDNLDGILDSFVTIHEDKEITPQAAQQLAISVEAYFRASGLNIPVGQWVPSFESSDQFSTELKDTRKSASIRIGGWLAEALKRIIDTIKRWWGQLTLSADAVGKYADKVGKKVKVLKGDPKSKDPVRLGASANFMTGRSGSISTPDRQIVESDARFSDFLHEWYGMFDKETHILKKLPNLGAVKIEFVVGRVLEVVPGSGVGLLNGAKVKISQSVKAAKVEAPVLTISQMEHGLETVESGLASFKKMQGEIDRLDKLSQSAAKEAIATANSYTDSVQGRAFAERTRALVKAFQLCSNGLTQVAPYYLKTIRAGVEYIAICTRRYETSTQDKTPS